MFQTSALWTVAHEGGHSFDGPFESDEDKAECSAARNVAAVAVALGMSPDPRLMDQFTHYAVTLEKDLQMDMPDDYNFDSCDLPRAGAR